MWRPLEQRRVDAAHTPRGQSSPETEPRKDITGEEAMVPQESGCGNSQNTVLKSQPVVYTRGYLSPEFKVVLIFENQSTIG